jgi:hypothetical protein
MPTRAGPVYVVTLFVGRDNIAACDEWLDEHMRATLRTPRVVACHVSATDDDDEGRAGRVCLYLLANDEVLDGFLEGAAAQIEATVAGRFGENSRVHARILREDLAQDLTQDLPLNDRFDCLNCGTRLRGQYCGRCGQRSRSRLISLWELVRDAFGDLFEFDSRIWQTVIPLLIRPGRLTHAYLQGRRARYMPPFRMYLVLSLIFFIVAFFAPREEFGFFFEPAAETAANVADIEESGVAITFDGESGEARDNECDLEADGLDELPEFLARRISIERLTQVCEQIVADKGRSLFAKVTDNTPIALIVLLPLMALVLKALYPLSRRYYVEHLLFFVHYHSFVFLLLTLQILLTRLMALLQIPDVATTISVVAASLYVPVYVFVAMRRVYGQGRFVTFLKFTVLALAYIAGFSIIIATTFLTAAFSI